MLVVDESKEIFNEKRLLKEKKKNPYSDYFFSNESVLPSIQRHRTPRTKAGTRHPREQQKALNGKLDAFNITSSFFLWPVQIEAEENWEDDNVLLQESKKHKQRCP